MKLKFYAPLTVLLTMALFSSVIADQISDNQNTTPSGFFINASGGLAQSQSYYQEDVASVFGNSSVDVTFPRQSQGAASLGLGYQWGFGKSNSWKNVFLGTSLNYYYFGRAVDPINSNIGTNGQILSTEYVTLSGIDAEGFVGMYLASPLSLQVGFGIGGGVGSNQQGLLGVFNVKLAYDVSSNVQLYAQYIRADFTTVGFAFLGFINASDETNVAVNSEQIGIRYLF
ncbi:hypothetical protein L3V82_04975 [Thiotrichales bacterium 19S3-7]|nr:hypothetical protein [Thiotrichales bacterium 19S3-7]MCF6801445.1 hypothetical protein [Thiotrichales bacterium 19S3-11]